MIGPARSAAVRALMAVASGAADLPTALAASRASLADERDRALATDIATGTLRWQRRLDYVIGVLARRPAAEIDPRLLLVLRISAYQLLYLDRVPAPAVVDDAVDLARAAHRSRGAGFVNAVLRSLVRQRKHLPLPSPPDGSDRAALAEYLGIIWSHPTWLVARWLERHGREHTEQWLAFNNARPSMTLRVNPRRSTREALMASLSNEDVEVAPTPFAPDGLIVVSGLPSPKDADGRFIVQDEASQLVSCMVGVRPGETVLDLCAAPGGKATALAADLDGRGSLVACDVRPRRLALLRDTVRQSGLGHVLVCHVSPAGDLPFHPVFDRVLVDAPCSGLGTIRRDPDIRWRRSADEFAGLAARQRHLLDRAAAVVAPGGRLVYATCSSEPDENEDVVEAFLATHPDFYRLDLRAEVPAALAPLIDPRGDFRTLPFAHGLEAFFAAALVRRPAQP